jgi:hypothetical protein
MLLGQLQLLAQEMTDEEAAVAAGGAIAAVMAFIAAFALILAAIGLFYCVCFWKVFSKADQPGWAAFIPIYQFVVVLQIVGRPTWWVILCLIPVVNFIVFIILAIDLAKSYGKDTMFAFGLILLGPICLPILAFGSAQYGGPSVQEDSGGAPA